MLESKFRFKQSEEEYNLILRKDKNWEQSKKRVLVLLQFVPSQCLHDGDIFKPELVKNTFTNCVKMAHSLCARYDSPVGNVSYALANFNAYRHLHLKGSARNDAELNFAKRARDMIKKLKPTHVFLAGEYAAAHMMPHVTDIGYKTGWVHQIGDISYGNSYCLDKLIADDGKHANLLGLWFTHLAYLLMGKNPHSLRDLQVKPKYVGDMKTFNRMMKVLQEAKLVSVDSETRNLSVLSNKIYTIQFATELEPEVGYVLPVDHPMTPWDREDRKIVKKRLQAFFKDRDPKQLVTFNGMYDLRIVRQNLKIPIIWHKVWEITAGEHDLEENLSKVKAVGRAQGGLLATMARYDNSFYLDAAFSKADRNTSGNVKPDDPDFMKYAAMDALCLLYIRREQLKRAQLTIIGGKPYKKRFANHVINIMGPTAHQLSHLQQDGSRLDRKYLRSLMESDSILKREIEKAAKDMRNSEAVQEANKQLLADSGMKSKSLFGSGSQWMFSPSKPAHRIKLFSEVKGMEITEVTKTGAPKIDKGFIHDNRFDAEVRMYAEWQKRNKVLSTYVKRWYSTLRTHVDSIIDDVLRASYSFFAVDTGRLNSEKPNLQQIPSRDVVAAIIKRALIVDYGSLSIRFDFSAHEIRMWSMSSGDTVLAGSFREGQKLRQRWIVSPTDEVKTELKTKGDVHIQNVFRFFRKWVEKSHPLRSSVKQVVFGVLYGMSSKTLGMGIKTQELDEIEKNIQSCKDPKELKKLKRKKQDILDTDYEPQAQEIMDKMFKEFARGGKWVEAAKKSAETNYYVISPIGRIRHLWAALTKDRGIVARQVRRGANAPIQGFASEVGVKASRLIMEQYYTALPFFQKRFFNELSDWDYRVKFNRIVHDASYFTVKYYMVIPMIHIVQYESTYGVARTVEKEFGVEFLVEPEIEMELGVRDDQTHAWNWSLPDLINCIYRSVVDAGELGVLEGSPREVIDQIMSVYRDKECRDFLQEHYPLLGVKDLDKQIRRAVPDYLESLKAKAKSSKDSKDREDYKRAKEWFGGGL